MIDRRSLLLGVAAVPFLNGGESLPEWTPLRPAATEEDPGVVRYEAWARRIASDAIAHPDFDCAAHYRISIHSKPDGELDVIFTRISREELWAA